MPKTAIDLLADQHQRSHGILTGSGTSALILSLWALGLRGKTVAIPNGVCYSVPMAVYLSGNKPMYVDLDLDTLSLGITEFEKWRSYDAVIAVHNYGARCHIEALNRFCADHKVPLIEDCCVSLGAKDIGHWGDLSVFSFGSGKILDAGGGGAILGDDARLLQTAHLLQQSFGPRDGMFNAEAALSMAHTALYNQHYATSRRKLVVFKSMVDLMGPRTLWSPGFMQQHGILYDLLPKLWHIVGERERKWQYLHDELKDVVDIFIPPEGSVHWRFNCFIEKDRDGLMHHLQAKGYNASSWHAPGDLFFEQGSRCGSFDWLDQMLVEKPNYNDAWAYWPVTDWVADHILNLWVDQAADEDYLKGVVKEVRGWHATTTSS